MAALIAASEISFIIILAAPLVLALLKKRCIVPQRETSHSYVLAHRNQ
jgi:hypothetical protein